MKVGIRFKATIADEDSVALAQGPFRNSDDCCQSDAGSHMSITTSTVAVINRCVCQELLSI